MEPDRSTIGIWRMALPSGKIEGSRELYRVLGIGEETELSEAFIRKAVHPDDKGAFFSEIRSAWKLNRPFKTNFRLLLEGGAPLHVRVQGMWLRNESNERTHLIGMICGITDRKQSERGLLHNEILLKELLNSLDLVLWARDFKTKRLMYISEASEKIFGIPQEEAFLLNSFLHIVYPDDLEIAKARVYGGGQQTAEYRIVHAQTGEIRWIQTHMKPELNEQGEVRALHGISIDITERKFREEMMKAQNEVLGLIALGKPLTEVLRTIAEQTNKKLSVRYCSILLLDRERNVFMNGASPGFPDELIETMENMPVDSEETYISRAVLSKKPVLINHNSADKLWNRSRLLKYFQAYGIQSCWFFPVLSPEKEVVATYSLYSSKTGRPRAYEMEMIEAFVHLTNLAIERKESERKILKLAYFDSLTGLFNRSYFTEQFNLYLKEAEPASEKFALLYIDLDQFKWVNDSLGHDAGDKLLAEAANRMMRHIGEEGILARLGGDEFALLVRNIGTDQEVDSIASRVMACFKEPVSILDHDIRIRLSIGISLYPEHGDTAHELLKRADTAMYQAKSAGRNNVKVYQSAYGGSIYNKFVLETQLYKGLAEKQFVLHYQPRIEMKNETIQSVEALIRWNHPDKGIIFPGEFIPFAEESGLIVSLGEWVMLEACRQNKIWQDRGFPAMRIAVNVSAQQFHEDGFVAKVKEILHETGLAPEWLEVEITESALMNHEKFVAAKLEQLGRMGVYVSIDDFGTGYSSLNYLKSFKANALKIDRSFIHDLTNDPKDAAITQLIISVARSLELEVIGEGVETKHQHEFLLRNGCEHAQGFLYGKPVTAAELEKKLQ
jgi:diguanylate cyclase (GGDEF)-like protein/PAS domain S-box-containing protein